MDDPYQPPKSQLTESPSRQTGRTEAQIAFDRCMIVLAGVMVVPMFATLLPGAWGEQRIPAGILYAALIAWWIRSLIGVFETWNAPDARVLRFSAIAVLALGGLGIAGLLVSHGIFGPG